METPPLERKLAAILAADVEGYSRLMHEDEERTLALLTRFRAIVDRLVEGHHGQIFGTAGDSVLAEFPSVVQAFSCAVAVQQSLWRENSSLSDQQRMQLRIGINVGDVMVKAGDIFGDGVNIAARLEGLAEPGGICVTRGVRDHLRDRVGARFDDLGEHAVKNIARPVRVFKVNFDRTVAPEPVIAIGSASALGSDAPAFGDDETEIIFWQSVTEADIRSEYEIYLDRYPTGQFAELARHRVANPAASEASPTELAFWDTVRDSGEAALLSAYLDKYPAGEFAELAKMLLQNAS